MTTDLLSEKQLSTLREEYGKIQRVDPAQPTFGKICEFLDKLGQPRLKQLEAANIKWLSPLARNRVIRPL